MAVYVQVPQQDGEVILSDGGERRTYRVDGGLISARSQAEADELLILVPGAKPPTAAAVKSVKGSRGKPAAKATASPAGTRADIAAAPSPAPSTPVSGAAAPGASR